MIRVPTDQELWELAKSLGGALAASGRRVVTAESCTGGWIAKVLTDVPGSSAWFMGGWVCYADEAKVRGLGVPSETIAAHGAVSEPVARALAANARERLQADFALAVSGVAGPSGGTTQKPIGLVWFAWSSADGTVSDSRRFAGDREAVRRQSVGFALEGLRDAVGVEVLRA